MIRKRLSQTAIDSESSTPFTVLLAIGDKGSVFVETVHDSLEDSIAEVVGLHRADRLAILIEPETLLAGDLLDPRILLKRHKHIGLGVGKGVNALVGEHHLTEKLILLHKIHPWGNLLIDSEFIALEDIGVNLGADSVKSGLISDTSLNQLLSEGDNAVFFLPSLDFFLGTI